MTNEYQTILRHMAVQPGASAYVLGCFERRVTLLSQQIRALNLVYAVLQQSDPDRPMRFGVIGGGLAGMTAALAAAEKGCETVLFEKSPDLIHLFRNTRHRHLHPQVYDWPDPCSGRSEAGLPLLNWSADYGMNVGDQILDDWNKRLTRLNRDPSRPRLTVYTNVESVLFDERHHPAYRGPLKLRWNLAKGGHRFQDFDIVILAVGFGLERSINVQGNVSYWHGDDLDDIKEPPPRSYFISGCGDGGLIDLLRVRIKGFRHDKLIEEFFPSDDPRTAQLKEFLLTIERDPRSSDPDWLYTQYQGAAFPEVTDRIRGRLREDTTAILNDSGPSPLSRKASILNRFLVSRLLALDVMYYHGKVDVKPARQVGYKVKWLGRERRELPFSRVVLRHGAEPALKASFPEIWELVNERLKILSEEDRTRIPIWTSGYFGETASIEHLAIAQRRANLEEAERVDVGTNIPLAATPNPGSPDPSPASMPGRPGRRAIDLRVDGWPVRDQGMRPTAVAHAVVACREHLARKRGESLDDTGLSPDFLHWMIKHRTDDTEVEGTRVSFAAEVLSKFGTCRQGEYRPGDNSPGDPPTKAAVALARRFRIEPRLYRAEIDADGLYALLDLFGSPVALSLMVFGDPEADPVSGVSNWTTPLGLFYGVVPDPPPQSVAWGGHCVCVTGFHPDPTEPCGGYFIFRNSWGLNWAKNANSDDGRVPEPGYGLVSASYVNRFAWEACMV